MAREGRVTKMVAGYGVGEGLRTHIDAILALRDMRWNIFMIMKLPSLSFKSITCHTLFNRRAAYISFSHGFATASYSIPAVQTLTIFLVFEMFAIGSPRISKKSARWPGAITPRSCRPK